MVNDMKIIRELNSSDVEIFRIVSDDWSQTKCYFMILDLHRKSTAEDFPHLKDIDDKSVLCRENFIKGIIVTEKELSQEIAEETENIITRLTEYSAQPSCSIRIEFKQISVSEFEKIGKYRKNLLNFFDTIIAEENLNVTISNVKDEDFNFLTQKITFNATNLKN
ncbi:MAG: hypothetical protein FWH04_06630 [Oscillospiraceae bacterium]|nr:hypothetical protein [Oscillospiraceae bacterium]